MSRFLVDEDLPRSLAHALRAAGHDATEVLRMTDGAGALMAPYGAEVAHSCTIATRNRSISRTNVVMS
jgi:hypothetical protein